MQLSELRSGWHGAACGLLLGLLLLLVGASVGVGQEAPDSPQATIRALRAEIARHDELYFKQAKPEISDAEYDRLKRRLQALEQAWPELAVAESGVGDDRSGRFPTSIHRERMLSLQKVYSEAAWRDYHAKLTRQLGRPDLGFVVEPKYDGLAISVTYESGELKRAVTRGNGTEGDDVTANVRLIPGLPPRLQPVDGVSPPRLVELRGEVFLTYVEFARINASRTARGAEPYAHPRNLAAGTLKSTDPAELAERSLSIVIYGWGAWEGPDSPASQQAWHAQVRAWGLPGVSTFAVGHSADEVWSAIQSMGQSRRELGFPIDGVVVKLDSVDLRNRVGADDHAPRWAVAYKFGAERAVTRLRAITWQVGRTGVLTPVAEFDPVELDGTKVSRATLHNASEIQRRDVRIGDYVEVEKAGEVIPAVVDVLIARRVADTPKYLLPETCPSCGAPVSANPGEVALRCSNLRCPAQLQRRLEHFASVDAVDLKGFGPATIAVLRQAGLLQSPADFYRLRREDLVRLEGIGARKADRLLAEIERSKRVELWRLLHGLSIAQVGPANAKVLAGAGGSLAGLGRMSKEQLVDAVGPSAAASIVAWLARPEIQADSRELIGAGLGRETRESPIADKLQGKVFVFTGALPGLTRNQATQRVLAAGGIVRESVSRQTDYLVAGEGAGAKRVEAERLGVTVLGAAEFRQMLGIE